MRQKNFTVSVMNTRSIVSRTKTALRGAYNRAIGDSCLTEDEKKLSEFLFADCFKKISRTSLRYVEATAEAGGVCVQVKRFWI